MLYDARLANRDERNIQTAVIYSGKIEEAPEVLRRGSITYQVTNVYMKAYDGDKEYARLHDKIEAGQALNDDDLLKLIFLPLMKSELSEAKMTFQAAELAKTMPEEKRNLALGVLVALGSRFLSEEEMRKLMEVIRMTAIAQWFREEGEIETRQEDICRFLAARFGPLSAGLQEKIKQISDPDVLDQVVTKLFAVNTLEEAKNIVSASLAGSVR